MKMFITLRGLIFTTVVVGFSFSCGTQASPSSIKVLPVPGEYLRNDYITELNKSKSALQALKQHSCQFIAINADSTGFIVSAIENFHDGVPIFHMNKNGTIDPTITNGTKAENVKLIILDSQHVNLGFNKFVPENYTYVGSVERFVASKVLAGKFADKNGAVYIFNDNGTASLGAETIKYSIGLDYPPSFIMDYYTSNNIDFGFKHFGDTLKIYKVSGESLFEGGTLQNNPWLILIKL